MSEMKVRAIMDGYYEEVYRKVGDEFVISDADDFSKRWMVAIDGNGNALAKQPAVKGGRKPAKEARAEADVALGIQGGRQANIESAMAASLGDAAKVVDVSAAANPDEPGISAKK